MRKILIVCKSQQNKKNLPFFFVYFCFTLAYNEINEIRIVILFFPFSALIIKLGIQIWQWQI